jgi:PST family polysaccharide transporter
MRRISDLARTSVIGAAAGTVASVPLVYFFGSGGIVPALIVVAACTTLATWCFTRKIDNRRPET